MQKEEYKEYEEYEEQADNKDYIGENQEEIPSNSIEQEKQESKVEEERYMVGQKQVEEDQYILGGLNDTSGVSGKQATMSESISSKNLLEDAYYQELEEIVDTALQSITAKMSEKKAAELENSTIKVMISRVKEDIKREEQIQKGFKKAIEQEKDTRKKYEKDNKELVQTLELITQKAESRKEEIIQKLQETQSYYEDLKENAGREKAKIESIRVQLKDMAVEVRKEIHALEMANAEAIGFLDELKKKTEYDKLVKNDRLKSIKQKSKMLVALISQDNTGTKPISHKSANKLPRASLK